MRNRSQLRIIDSPPPGWRLLSLGAVVESAQYGTSEAASSTGRIPIIGMQNIVNGKITTTDLDKITLSPREYESLKLTAGDILINRTNSYELVGKTGIYDSEEPAVFASYLVRLKPKVTEVLPKYLNYWLNSPQIKLVIKKIATKAVSQANINPTELQKFCPVLLPPISMQEKIISFLDSISLLIQKTDQLIQAKQKLLQSLVSRLIFNNLYPLVKTKDFASEVSKRNISDQDRVLSVTNKNGFVLPHEQFERRVASENVSNYKIVTKGQYAYNPSRINVGSIARLDKWDHGILSPMYVVFQLDDAKINSDYFLHWLSSTEAKQRIRLSAQGSVRETVSFSDFGNIKIPLPELIKQNETAQFLDLVKKEVDIYKVLLQKYKLQKQSLMQELLTGEIRL